MATEQLIALPEILSKSSPLFNTWRNFSGKFIFLCVCFAAHPSSKRQGEVGSRKINTNPQPILSELYKGVGAEGAVTVLWASSLVEKGRKEREKGNRAVLREGMQLGRQKASLVICEWSLYLTRLGRTSQAITSKAAGVKLPLFVEWQALFPSACVPSQLTEQKSPMPGTHFQSSYDSFTLETVPNKSIQLLCAKSHPGLITSVRQADLSHWSSYILM